MSPHHYGLDFWDLLMLTNVELVAHGVPPDEATKLRMAYTGHERSLSPAWIRTVGSWGRVETLSTIAKRAGKTKAQAKSYAGKRGLRTATKKNQHLQAHLAAGLYFDRHRSPAESCRWWGVLAVERVLLMSAFQEVMDSHAVNAATVLGWSPVELLLKWKESDVAVEPPWDRLHEFEVERDSRSCPTDSLFRLDFA